MPVTASAYTVKVTFALGGTEHVYILQVSEVLKYFNYFFSQFDHSDALNCKK